MRKLEGRECPAALFEKESGAYRTRAPTLRRSGSVLERLRAPDVPPGLAQRASFLSSAVEKLQLLRKCILK